jgi:hypothetical protein
MSFRKKILFMSTIIQLYINSASTSVQSVLDQLDFSIRFLGPCIVTNKHNVAYAGICLLYYVLF